MLSYILLTVFLVFSPCLKSDFLNWDDTTHLLENHSIRVLDREHILDIFQHNINKTYIPLTSLSFALEYKFFGYNSFVYHLDNVVLHLLVVALIFFFGMMLGLNLLGAGVAAFLFGIHPLHVESVAWITERKDVLYSGFFMLGLLAYVKYLKGGNKLFYFLALGATLLSMLAKPMAISIPLIFLLCDWFLRRPWTKSVFVEKIPYFLIVGALAWLTYREHIRVPGDGIVESILVWIWTITFYIRQFLFPGILVPLYHLPQPISFLNLEYALAVIVFSLLIVILWRFRKKRWLIFAFLFYFFSIFFLLRFDDSADINVVADRFMYLPSLGFYLWVGFCWQNIWTWLKTSRFHLLNSIIIVGVLLIVLSFAFRSYMQCKVWKNSLTLWRYQLLFNPDTPIPFNNLANALQDEPDFPKIQQEYRKLLELKKQGISNDQINIKESVVNRIEFLFYLYKKAVALDDKYIDAYYNWAKLNQDVGNLKEAIELYNKTLSLNPLYKDSYFNLGRLYQQDNDVEKAMAAYDQTIQSDPENPDVYINVVKALTETVQKDGISSQYSQFRENILSQFRNLARLNKESEVFFTNLGDVYQELRDYESARVAYQMALEINPNYVNALNNLGNTYLQLGQLKEAAFLFNKVISIHPKDMFAHLNLGVVYGRLQDYSKSIDFYQKAIQVNPKYSEAYFQLGFIYEASGQLNKAIESYKKTSDLSPEYFEAYYNLGNVYAKMNQAEKAIAAYQRTIELNPNHVDAFVNLVILCFRIKDYQQSLKYYDEAKILGWDAPKAFFLELERYRKTP